ncbi:hypothetical protein HN385_03550 [archaeon]|jgi:sugar-specific transcriptional regulator TrmB|nr:hypothetical protein [archaeon]MBT3451206.1 hypothetical protein [archaeon]MBT6869772.1 hypothetical protein [archaeon]MBT7192727.1 hypothetical protein [archaeon]MBT7380752.1 hypothetical protein [archaeon]
MDVIKSLEKIGLSPNEIKVYLYLIDHGQSKAGKIAKGTEIQRSSAYGAINSLVYKGLISYATLGKIKLFQATSPSRLLEYIKEQEDAVKNIIPHLSKRHRETKTSGNVRMFKGERGVKSVLKDILREGKDNYVFGSEGQLSKRLPVFVKQFIREQNFKGMKTKNLAFPSRLERSSKGTSYRFVDKDVRSNVVTNIYGDKIAIIVWTETPEAIIIENPDAAKSYQAYFEFMWKNAKKKK